MWKLLAAKIALVLIFAYGWEAFLLFLAGHFSFFKMYWDWRGQHFYSDGIEFIAIISIGVLFYIIWHFMTLAWHFIRALFKKSAI